MTENTADPTAGEAVDDFYAAMRRHYPFTDKVIASFIAHTQADQKLDHQDVFLARCRSVPPLTRAEVRDALGVARAMAEHLLCFLDGIDRFYERFPAVPPDRVGLGLRAGRLGRKASRSIRRGSSDRVRRLFGAPLETPEVIIFRVLDNLDYHHDWRA